jgi:hypothetical protein
MKELLALILGLSILAFAYWHLSPKVMEKPSRNVIERIMSEEPEPEIIVPIKLKRCPKRFKYFCI